MVELPTLVIANVDISYKEGFERKHKNGVVFGTRRAIEDEAFLRESLLEVFADLGIDPETVVKVTITGTIVPPPSDLEEEALALDGLVATVH